MKIQELAMPGCFKILPEKFTDERGLFLKTFHNETFLKCGIGFNAKEEFFSISKKNVLRGLHFQSPPSAHNKLVYCPKGAVLDFFVDLRIGSPTYKKSLSIELNENNGIVLYLPIGIAHGFLSLEDDSLMIYKTDCSYDPSTDNGLLFDSCGIKLPIDESNFIISERDKSFLTIEKYKSEFHYE
jgi:dTDP-4-dehydrorhamnose 3,5-epimerase